MRRECDPGRNTSRIHEPGSPSISSTRVTVIAWSSGSAPNSEAASSPSRALLDLELRELEPHAAPARELRVRDQLLEPLVEAVEGERPT